MCSDLLLKFLKLYQKFRVLTERLYNCCPNVKQKVSELLQGASKTHSSKYELYMNSVQIEKLKLEISNIESTDLGLV